MLNGKFAFGIMTIPKFKRRHAFMHDLEAPCLHATLPNSVIPKLAAKHIAKFADDPGFDIFLRGKDPAKITDWQKEMLEHLITKGELASAIEQGMNEYYEEQRDDCLVDYENRAREDMKRNGVLPHVTLLDLVIDDSKREVILSLSTKSDSNLEEHGIVIYLKEGRWKFDSDYAIDYLSEVEEEEGQREEIGFDEDAPDPPPVEVHAPADISFLFGAWDYDPEADKERMKKEGDDDDSIRMWVNSFAGRRFEFSRDRMLYWYKHAKGWKPQESVILECQKKENKITIKFRDSSEGKIETIAFLYENDRLRNPHGGIYKRAAS